MKNYNKNSLYSIGLIVLQFLLNSSHASVLLANQFGIPAAQSILMALMLISLFFAVRSMSEKGAIATGVVCIVVNIIFGLGYFIAPYLAGFPL